MFSMNKKYLITVIGPTAIGKTDLSIRLALHFNTEIISSDSRQFYKEMAIGTAVPTLHERKGVTHHFIQDRSILEDYSVGQFEKDAINKLTELFKSRDTVVMVGGSGLYIDAVLKGLDHFPEVDPAIRKKLIAQVNSDGIESLQSQLKELDLETYQKIDLKNQQRVIRALEICVGSGKPYSEYLTKTPVERDFFPIKIGLTAARETIYDRINKRVDLMIQEGLLEEAKKLHEYRDLNALQTVGYKELFNYLDGNYTFDQAVSEIKKNTRRFAKRQGTWFRKDAEIKWFDYRDETNLIIEYIEQRITTNAK